MSKTEETRPQEIKKPKTVQVSIALPWTLIVMVMVGFASGVTFWNMRGAQEDAVSARAASIVEQLSKSQK